MRTFLVAIVSAFLGIGLCISNSFAFAQVASTEQATEKTKSANSQLDNWPQWRGPLGTGESPKADPPIRWSEETVKWKVPLPGLGHSSPVVWKDKIFVTLAEPFGEEFEPIHDNAPGSHDNLPVKQKHRYIVMAIDRGTGKTIWSKKLNENVPHEGAHYTASLASGSPVVDKQHVFAFFGSHGLYCLDHDGKIVWEKNVGKMNSKHAHGEGASPALFKNTLVINWDHEGQSFVVAYNKSTGKEIWKKNRKEVTSWASPIIVNHNNRPQVIVAGTDRVRSYDLKDGKVIWECGGLSHNVVATPVYANGIAIVGSSYEKKAIFAVRLDGANGDITETRNVLWMRHTRTPYVPSPLLYKGHVYYLRHYQGVLSRLAVESGEELMGPFRLTGLRDIYSSPIAAAGRIYVTGRSGVTFVVSEKDLPRMLSANQLDDSFSASPAVVGKDLYLRGEKFLYCLTRK